MLDVLRSHLNVFQSPLRPCHPPLTPPSRPNPRREGEPVSAGDASGSARTPSASLPPQAAPLKDNQDPAPAGIVSDYVNGAAV